MVAFNLVFVLLFFSLHQAISFNFDSVKNYDSITELEFENWLKEKKSWIKKYMQNEAKRNFINNLQMMWEEGKSFHSVNQNSISRIKKVKSLMTETNNDIYSKWHNGCFISTNFDECLKTWDDTLFNKIISCYIKTKDENTTLHQEYMSLTEKLILYMNSVKIELLIEIDRQSKLLTSDIQEVDDREKKLKDEYRRKIHDELLKVLDDDLCNSKKEEELRSIIVNSKNMFDRINVKASVTSSFNRYETDQVTSDISKDGDGHVYDDEVLTPKSKGKQKLLINVFLLAIIAAIALTGN